MKSVSSCSLADHAFNFRGQGAKTANNQSVLIKFLQESLVFRLGYLAVRILL